MNNKAKLWLLLIVVAALAITLAIRVIFHRDALDKRPAAPEKSR
jgi:hypothetical protein